MSMGLLSTASAHSIYLLVTVWCKQTDTYHHSCIAGTLWNEQECAGLHPLQRQRSAEEEEKKRHSTWPVWPSGNVKETLFFCSWKTNAKWVTDAKKWTQCEIQPRESRFFHFFSVGTEGKEQLTQSLDSQRSHISNPTLPPFRRFLHCS